MHPLTFCFSQKSIHVFYARHFNVKCVGNDDAKIYVDTWNGKFVKGNETFTVYQDDKCLFSISFYSFFISSDESGDILYDTTTASRYFTSKILDTSREFDIKMSIKIGNVEIKSSRMRIVLL